VLFWVIMHRNNPAECSSHLLRGRSLKSHITLRYICTTTGAMEKQ